MKKGNKERTVLLGVTALALILFLAIYRGNRIPVEKPEPVSRDSSLSQWTVEESKANSQPFREDKNIYEQDNSIYDVYISVFPTKDEHGVMLDLSAFSKHESRNHDYNPTLQCNVQILPEGKQPDPLVNLDKANGTIRVRGNSSRGDLYKSYRVKLLDERDAFFGQTSLNINKHCEDIFKAATKLQADLLTRADNIGSYRTYYMRVWIRDASLPEEDQEFTYYGLFTEIEQPNKTYLGARGLPRECNLYKARNFNFSMPEELRDVDDPLYDERAFETILGIREGKDHKKLLQMLAAVNDETNDFEQVFDRYFDEENFLTWVAFSLLTGNNDIINHNYIIYSPANCEKWYFIPWDFDGALQFGKYANRVINPPLCLQGGQKLNQSVLIRRYYRLDHSREKIQAKMEELLSTVMTQERIEELVSGYLPVLEKTLPLPPDIGLLGRLELENIPDYLYSLRDGFVHSYETFQQAGEYPAPMYVAAPEQMPDGTVRFSWEPSFSYQGRTVTYSVRVYEDYRRENLVVQKSGLIDPFWETEEPLPPDVYYLEVTATDSQGHEQLNLERYEGVELTEGPEQDISYVFIDGLLEFEVK